MPPKKHPETPEEQATRFKREVEKMIEAGELDPEKAHRMLDNVVKGRVSHRAKKGT